MLKEIGRLEKESIGELSRVRLSGFPGGAGKRSYFIVFGLEGDFKPLILLTLFERLVGLPKLSKGGFFPFYPLQFRLKLSRFERLGDEIGGSGSSSTIRMRLIVSVL